MPLLYAVRLRDEFGSQSFPPRGPPGEEIVDEQFKFTNARRRSNSSGYSNHLHDFKTKFEQIEPEVVFEEDVHGPMGSELDKESTTSSSKSIEEEDASKKL